MSANFNQKVYLINGEYMNYCDTDEVMRLANNIINFTKNYDKMLENVGKNNKYLREAFSQQNLRNNKFVNDASDIHSYINREFQKIKIEGYWIEQQWFKSLLHAKCQEYNLECFRCGCGILHVEEVRIRDSNNPYDKYTRINKLRTAINELQRVGTILNGYGKSTLAPKNSTMYNKDIFNIHMEEFRGFLGGE